jgi:hypothetical protein
MSLLERGTNWTGEERRNGPRSPVGWKLHYSLPTNGRLHKVHNGKTLNVSRNGLLFTAVRPLAVDAPLELTIRWSHRAAKLIVQGQIVRCDSTVAALKIAQCEIR